MKLRGMVDVYTNPDGKLLVRVGVGTHRTDELPSPRLEVARAALQWIADHYGVTTKRLREMRRTNEIEQASKRKRNERDN